MSSERFSANHFYKPRNRPVAARNAASNKNTRRKQERGAYGKGAQEMSKSRANELLQTLHSKMTARFAGKDKEFCANNAYDLCREIIKEVDSEQVQSKESER